MRLKIDGFPLGCLFSSPLAVSIAVPTESETYISPALDEALLQVRSRLRRRHHQPRGVSFAGERESGLLQVGELQRGGGAERRRDGGAAGERFQEIGVQSGRAAGDEAAAVLRELSGEEEA